MFVPECSQTFFIMQLTYSIINEVTYSPTKDKMTFMLYPSTINTQSHK